MMSNQRPSSLAVGDRKTRVVLRGGAGKRRNRAVPLSQKVTLDRVLGITLKDNCALTCDPKTGNVAYIAGCVIVIFNPRKNKQFHIINQSRKTLTALSYSGDGRYLVSGECGHNPAVRIWDVQEKTQVSEFHGHKFGISCVAFSPDMHYVVSVGEQHDMVINVWDWKKNTKHSSGKIAAKVTGLAFSEDGTFFVAVGNRCVKFYYLQGKSRTRQIQALPGRSGIMGEQKNNFFCSVACGRGQNKDKVYAITKSGFLCEINNNRLLDKWVELRTASAFSLAANEEFVFVACDGGIIRLFNASTLHFIATLPKPHNLGVNVSAGIDASHMLAHSDNAKYPDAVAITFDDSNKKLTCVYSDHSVYMWDIHDVRKIGKQWSFLYHSACVFGVETYPELKDGNKAALPPGSFLTCSSDGTIRIWNVDPTMNTNIHKRNIYSHELLKVLYVCDDSMETLQDKDYNPAGTTDKTDPEKGKTSGVRCIRVSPDGQMLASGDRSGNVRVHDLQFWDELHEIEAHNSEVLCLEYTQPDTGYNLLASTSRDRLIHVFDMDKNCNLVQTLDDHSSSITSVKFSSNGEQLQMISCGADKALMFRMAVLNPELQFVRNHHVVSKTTLYDLAIDTTQKFITTACQDRNLRIYNIGSGKLKRTYKGAQSDEGTLIRVELDPSGIYAATSCSDKTLSIYDFYSGECVATMTGHSELVTGIKFTSDCKQLISVSGDGCIFIWKLPWELTNNMKERLREMGEKVVEPPPEYNMLRRGTYVVPPEITPQGPEPKAQAQAAAVSAWAAQQPAAGFQPAMQSRPETEDETDDRQPDEDSTLEEVSFDTGLLPLWAQKQVNLQAPANDIPSPTNYSSPTHPRGKWAQNIPSGGGIKVKSQMEELNQSIELRLEDCIDRRRYTVEPDILLEQVRPFSRKRSQSSVKPKPLSRWGRAAKGPFAGMDAEEISRICGGEFVPASQKFGLATREEFEDSEKLEGFVTRSRGSEPFAPPGSLRSAALDDTDGPNGTAHANTEVNEDDTNVEDIEGDEDEEEVDGGEEEEEEKDDDSQSKEIIFYPPEEEQSSSPESLKFQVTESTKSHEQLAKRNSKHRGKDVGRESLSLAAANTVQSKIPPPLSSSSDGNEYDGDESEGDDDDDEEEEEEEEEEGVDNDATPTASPRRKPEPVEPPSPTVTSPDEEKFLNSNFSFVEKDQVEDDEEEDDDFTEKEKFGMCLEQLQSRFASDEISSGRLSISSRFLSRSQHSHARAPAIPSQTTVPVASSMSAEEYLRRRKEEVARAVEETRKRLTSLGWAIGDKKLPPTPSSKMTTGPPTGAKVKPAIIPRQNKPTPQNAKPTLPTSNSQDPTGQSESKGASINAAPHRTGSVLSKEGASSSRNEALDSNLTKEAIRTDKPSESGVDGCVDTNKSASKESSQGSSPEAVKTHGDGEGERIVDPAKGSKSSVLDEVNRKGNDPKMPAGLVKQSSVSSEDAAIDLEAEMDSNKENVSSVSLLSKKTAEMGTGAAPGTKAKSGGDKSGGSPSLTPPSRSSHARSASMEREKTAPTNESPARQKRRESRDRMLPLLPTPKTRSYEGRTESSIAKVVRRISESSPPPSPNALKRKKKMSLPGGSATVTKSGPMKAMDPSLMVEGKVDSDANQDLSSEASVESSRTEEGTTVKSTADKLAMPPPSTTYVSKAKQAKKGSASKMSERGRKRSSSMTSTTTSSRGRRASTSSLPSDSRSKVTDTKSKSPPNNNNTQTKSKSPVVTAKTEPKQARAEETARTTKSSSNKTTETPEDDRVSKDAILKEDIARDSPDVAIMSSTFTVDGPGEVVLDPTSTVTIDTPSTATIDTPGTATQDLPATVTVDAPDTPPRETPVVTMETDDDNDEDAREEDAAAEVEEDDERSSSVSEDTMVSESKKGSVQGPMVAEKQEAPLDTGGETTPEEVRAMRADLRIDLADISVDDPEEDLGQGLRQNVDIMKKAFDSCLQFVAKIERKGNHKTDLSYFNSAFANMDKSFETKVQPVVQRSALASPDNTLSDGSEDYLGNDHHTRPTGATSEASTSRSMPSLANLLGESAARGKRSSKRSGSLDASSPEAMVLLQHYSDMLVSMVRSKMEEGEDVLLSGRSRVSSLDLDPED